MSTISCSSVLVNIFFLLTLHLQFLLQSKAQTYMNMTRGVQLSASGATSSIASPSGNFAIGFRPINQSHFLLAIWFNVTSPQPIIWFATTNDHNPVLVTANATFILNYGGSLSLSDSVNSWNPDLTEVDHTYLTDEGNFILYDRNGSPVWESFQNPTDTIVPGQSLSSNGSQLWSKLTDTDFSKGRFTLTIQTDGNIVLYPLSLPTYDRYHAIWSSGTWSDQQDCNDTSEVVQLVFNSNGSLYYIVCGETGNITAAPNYSSDKYYQHATLDPDGVFRVYIYPKKPAVGEWEVVGKQLVDGCSWPKTNGGGGVCGFNAYCNSSNANQTRLDCECPPEYSFVDQDRKYEGCMPDFATPDCEDYHSVDFEFRELNNTDWPIHDSYENFTFLHGDQKKACLDYCMSDCFCMAAVFRADGCWMRSLPLQFGQHGTSMNRTAYMKVRINKNGSTIAEKNMKRKLLPSRIGFILLGGLIVAVVILSAAVFFLMWKSAHMNSNLLAIKPRAFSFKEIEHATRGFTEELGRGTYGIVYRGLLEADTQLQIAVKKLEIANEGEREFKSEVYSIGQTNHKNLVRMIGFCYEGKHRMLVYEYMSKGSLARFIFGDTKLEWNQRAHIALGIAKGLQYLHEECSSQIIHCDIKPQNILLDDNLVPKISDFGVAKLLGGDQTRTSTFVRGTKGYLAPEWFKDPEITAKVDVYSFGVVLLEIICCKRHVERWATECLRTNSWEQLVEDDEEARADINRLELFARVALSCIQDDPTSRPTMREVAHILAGDIAVSPSSPSPTSLDQTREVSTF